MTSVMFLELGLAATFGVISLALLGVLPTRYYLLDPAYLKKLEAAFRASRMLVRKKKLLTDNENEFMRRLERALPEYHVMAQVSMGALMDPSPQFEHLRYKYASKIVDYVICQKGTKEVVALVELDDRTHDVKKDADAARDMLTASAGYKTLRWDSRRKPSVTQIRNQVLALAQ